MDINAPLCVEGCPFPLTSFVSMSSVYFSVHSLPQLVQRRWTTCVRMESLRKESNLGGQISHGRIQIISVRGEYFRQEIL